MKDFKNYRFRASQISKIMGGTIGLADIQYNKMVEYNQRQLDAFEGKAKPLTERMEMELKDLISAHENKELPKGMQTELRKIYRAEKYNRNFVFTNKYVQKGIQQEEEAITTYQMYRNQNGIPTLFSKNTIRLENEWISGEPDISDNKDIFKCKEGFDTKCSWSLESFPFIDDELDFGYECQNQSYMWLTGAEKWTTAYLLVNATEHQVNAEKMKFFYAYGMPQDANDKYYDEYIDKCKDVEKMMIFDYDRFVKSNPGHIMEISKDEWFGEGYDIPLEDRVVEKVSIYNPELIKEMKERILLARDYLKTLK